MKSLFDLLYTNLEVGYCFTYSTDTESYYRITRIEDDEIYAIIVVPYCNYIGSETRHSKLSIELAQRVYE